MTSTSLILVRKDLDAALEALHDFGQFHIEDSSETETLAGYRQALQKAEGNIADIDALMKKFNNDKGTLVDIFRTVKPVKAKIASENWQSLAEIVSKEVAALKKETDSLTAPLEELHAQTIELEHIKDMLEAMKTIGADLRAIKELKSISIRIGCARRKLLPELEKALSGFSIIFHSCFMSKEVSFVCMAFSSKHQSDLDKILKTHHAEIFEVPEDLPHNVPEALKDVDKRLFENSKKQLTLNRSLQKLGGSSRYRLLSLRETVQNIVLLLQAKLKILQSDRLAVIKGFVPRRQTIALNQKVDLKLRGNALVLEGETAQGTDPPTMFRNYNFVKPFEEITRLYGLPHYDELDPTPFIAVMFPLIFGLMFGDMGHGFVLLVGGLALGFLIKNQKGIKNVCWILAASGIGAIVAGLLFGEFFGMQVIPPLWFNPFDNVLQFLIFSLFIGVAQIVSGLILELANFALARKWVDVLLTSIPKIVFYVSSVYLVSAYGLNLESWFAGPILIAITPFLVLVFGKAICLNTSITYSHAVGAQSDQFSLGQRFFESGDLVTRLLSNTVSYARILALLMAHWALLLATYVVAGLVATSAIGVLFSGIIIVVGNGFVIALEGLIVFVHTLRLHFYEWFSKFYKGTGTPFNSFKQSFEHTEVVLGNSVEKN